MASILLEGAKGKAVKGFHKHLSQASSAIQLHQLIMGGLPFSVVPHLLESTTLHREELLGAIGLNLRTMQRYIAAGKVRLTEEQSDRVWRFGAFGEGYRSAWLS